MVKKKEEKESKQERKERRGTGGLMEMEKEFCIWWCLWVG
jgi:hypothetical protein